MANRKRLDGKKNLIKLSRTAVYPKIILVKFKDLDINQSYTYADYLNWKFEETVELIKGKIFKMSPPNTYHQEISGNLYLKIGCFLNKKSCKIFHAPFDVRLPIASDQKKDEEIQTVVQPDISVICELSKIDFRGCLGPPDWIIEIASPSTSKKDMKDKFEVYEFSGVKEYWLVFPLEENILVYTLNDQGRYVGLAPFTKDDRISPVLFPNLNIDLKDIFPERNLAEEPWNDNYFRM